MGNAMQFDFIQEKKLSRTVTFAPHETDASMMKIHTAHANGITDWCALNETRVAELVRYLQSWLGERSDLKKKVGE